MRVTLLHHPEAGDGGHGETELVAMLQQNGYTVRYQSTDEPWQEALQWPADLVAVAGGDGTVAGAIRAMVGVDLPLAALPLGTANNICRTLRIAGATREVMRDWPHGTPATFDVWRVTADAKAPAMVEALGGGIVAELIAQGELVEGADLLGRPTERALALFDDVTEAAEPADWVIEVDGRDLSGSFLGVEVMNIRFVGPNLPFAPDADPGDGLLDVVRIRPGDRAALHAYVQDRSTGTSVRAPDLDVVRGRSVRLTAPAGVRLHLDDSPWPNGHRSEAPLTISVEREPDSPRVLRPPSD